MKKLAVIILFFVLLLLMAGCSDVNKPASFNTNTPNTESSSSIINSEASESSPVGTEETFTRGNLVLEITNVCEVRTVTKLAEGTEPYEETIYTCYPGATLSVVNADMSDPTYTEDKKAHPQWGLYDI